MDQEMNLKVRRFANEASPKIVRFLAAFIGFLIGIGRTVVSEIWNEVRGGGE